MKYSDAQNVFAAHAGRVRNRSVHRVRSSAFSYRSRRSNSYVSKSEADAATCTASASFQPRFTASSMAKCSPCPATELKVCAASPTSAARPLIKCVAACFENEPQWTQAALVRRTSLIPLRRRNSSSTRSKVGSLPLRSIRYIR